LQPVSGKVDVHHQNPFRRLFHDGTPLTSMDEKVTFDRLRAPAAGMLSIRQALFADITRIDTPDAGTVVMTLKAPDASFLGTARPARCKRAGQTVMGSGPFVFVEHVKLTRNARECAQHCVSSCLERLDMSAREAQRDGPCDLGDEQSPTD
jgi:hypothetical protein